MIFCVEDDASIRDIELYTLRSTGFEARGFEDGGAFLAALETERPELVILDVMLPGMDGVELLRRMKAAASLADIPVIMATAKGAEYDVFRSPTRNLNCCACSFPVPVSRSPGSSFSLRFGVWTIPGKRGRWICTSRRSGRSWGLAAG